MDSKNNSEKFIHIEKINELTRQNGESGEVFFVSENEEQKVATNENKIVTFNTANSFESLTYDEVADKGLSEEQIDIVVNKILSAITNMATSKCKESSYLDINEIEHLKKSHPALQDCDYNVKRAIEKELNGFQNEIQERHKENLKKHFEQKHSIEKQITVLEYRKKKIVEERISKFLWPFNDETKACDGKIYNLKCQMRTCLLKIAEVEKLRPMAKENDITKFNLKLKEKYAK